MTVADQFVGLVLLARDLAHISHWKTRSYAEHVALADFYDNVLELIDQFVEQYQGYYDELMSIKRAPNPDAEDIKAVLERQMEWIDMKRDQICDKDESPLQNTIDEIVRQYQSTLYKLRFLS